MGETPFSPEGAGMSATVKARRIPGWKLAHGWAGEISTADTAWAHDAPADAVGPVEVVRLVPYGCTNRRSSSGPFASCGRPSSGRPTRRRGRVGHGRGRRSLGGGRGRRDRAGALMLRGEIRMVDLDPRAARRRTSDGRR